jgi:hypothetical protein
MRARAGWDETRMNGMTRHRIGRWAGRSAPSLVLKLLKIAGLLLLLTPAGISSTCAAEVRQTMFASPDEAASALIEAARAGHTVELVKILGPGGKKLVNSGDPVADQEGRAKFVAAYDQQHALEAAGDGRMTLLVGEDHYPTPIPIVRTGTAWRFDAKAAEQEILARRIGRNELGAIEVCHAYVDAQKDYAAADRNADGVREYAQKFASSRGKHDGLYWPAGTGEPQSPMGQLMASAHAEGYKRLPYHGYYYKILKGQGKDAAGGAYSYMAHNRMIGGFALVAFPAKWGDSGIMTFLVNQDGTVFEKNLGPRTEATARAMTVFDPDQSWKAP